MLRITANSFSDAQECPLRNVLDKVADKWGFLIFVALEQEPQRFNAIKRQIGDISSRVLSRKLRELERDGYIARRVISSAPPRVEYQLTELGRSVLKPVEMFLDWAVKTYPEVRRSREAFDHNSISGDLEVT